MELERGFYRGMPNYWLLGFSFILDPYQFREHQDHNHGIYTKKNRKKSVQQTAAQDPLGVLKSFKTCSEDFEGTLKKNNSGYVAINYTFCV